MLVAEFVFAVVVVDVAGMVEVVVAVLLADAVDADADGPALDTLVFVRADCYSEADFVAYNVAVVTNVVAFVAAMLVAALLAVRVSFAEVALVSDVVVAVVAGSLLSV